MHYLVAIPLLIVSLGFGFDVDAYADPLPSLPPPTYDIPFDDHDEATTQVEIAQEVLTFLLTMQSYEGQSEATVREAVSGDLVRDEQGKLIFERTLADHGVLEGYDFRSGALVRGEYWVLQRPINRLNEFIDYYAAVKHTLTDSYGTPMADHTLWENDLYQPLPDYWGVAVMIGYLRYEATWETSEGTITLELSGDRHSKLTIEYRSHAYREPEQMASKPTPSASLLESFDTFCHSTAPQTPAFCRPIL